MLTNNLLRRRSSFIVLNTYERIRISVVTSRKARRKQISLFRLGWQQKTRHERQARSAFKARHFWCFYACLWRFFKLQYGEEKHKISFRGIRFNFCAIQSDFCVASFSTTSISSAIFADIQMKVNLMAKKFREWNEENSNKRNVDRRRRKNLKEISKM